MRSIVRQHSAALLGLAAVCWLWLHPILQHLHTAIPGAGAGDNVTFVWNLWWMRYVLHHPGYSFFSTPFLFHPFGVNLTLNTHTALPAFVAALLGPDSLIASLNLLVVAHVYLNFVCMYALAYTETRHRPAAVVASLIFGCSPFVGAHLTGHFNLIAAWIVPLVCLVAFHTFARRPMARAALLGAVLAGAAYLDYYLFVFATGLVVVRWIARSFTLSLRPAQASIVRRRALWSILALLAVDLLVIAWILLTKGGRLEIGPVQVSVRGVGNPITFAWILVLAYVTITWASRLRVTFRLRPAHFSPRVFLVAVAVTMLLLTPLLVNAAQLWAEGGYVSQPYHWRSGPAGVDAATLLLGNPYHWWWGNEVRGVYSRLGIDPIEDSGWISIGAMVLVAIAMWTRRNDTATREWVFSGAVFLVWALGPWLMAFGRRSPVILPAIAIRYVPIVANARIPGRAMVVVYVAVAALAAIAIARLAAQSGRTRMLASFLVVVVLVECVPAAPPLFSPHVASFYGLLRAAPRPGAVCELPLGFRDGFGETGRFDSAVLFYQTVHERPITGGFMARLPPHIARDYAAMPLVASLLRLSSGGSLHDEVRTDPTAAAAFLHSRGIRYVILDKGNAAPDLVRYVESNIPLRIMAEEANRILYEVPSFTAPGAGASGNPASRTAEPAEEVPH
jgi:hypothetical protein